MQSRVISVIFGCTCRHILEVLGNSLSIIAIEFYILMDKSPKTMCYNIQYGATGNVTEVDIVVTSS